MSNNKPQKPAPAAADKYITITVAEYVFLTKAAAVLEIIINDTTYNHADVVEAAKVTVQEIARRAEEGADL